MPACPNCGRDNSEEARFCQFCGAAIDSPRTAAEQRKVVTIVFSDVTGFTALGEQLDPESLRGVMSRFFDEMKQVIERHGGTVEKFIGDAVMAVFGIPQLHEDDALRAVRAASEMGPALASLNRDLAAEQGVTLQIRTGVDTGEVVASGDPSASERLVTGDAVNIAARLEQAADPGEILIGPATLDLVRDAVEVEAIEPLDLKGKSDPFPAFRLVEVRHGAVGRERRLSAPMVGRDRQLRSLVDAFDNSVADRSCHLFTVLGSAGVGKSRLVQEFRSEVKGRATIHGGRCVSYGEGITFLPIDAAVRSATGVGELDSPADLTNGIRNTLEGSADQDNVTSRLAGLLQATSEAVSLQDGFWAVRKLFEHIAAEEPLVLIIDDIHWAEPAMLDLIEHIADWSRDAPILLLCMARPELLDDRPNWGGGKLNATSILLEPLAAEDSQQLMRHLLGDANLPEEVEERITTAAEGNPLFVEEMLAMLVHDGLLHLEGEQWLAVGDVSQVSIPPTVQSLVAARLDRLGPHERAVIERGSVEGKLFHMGTVTALVSESERAAIPDRLMSLVRKELIRPDRSELIGDEAFRFRHLLVRDAAYGSMSKKTRADLHQRFAEWLLAHALPARGGIDAILAYHFDQAYQYRVELGKEGEAERRLAELAGSRYMTAGEAALAHGDYLGARGLFERAAILLGPTTDLGLQARLLLGRTLVQLDEYESADTTFSDIERLAQASGDRHLELKAGIGLLRVRDRLETQWSDDMFILTSKTLERELTELGDKKGALEALMLRLNWLPRNEGIDQAVSAIEMAREIGAAELESDASWWLLAVSFWAATPASEGVELARSMLQQKATNLQHRGLQLLALGGFLNMLGRVSESQIEIERGVEMFRELGLSAEPFTAFIEGWIAIMTGDLDRADRALRAGYIHSAEKGEKNRLSSIAAGTARVAALRDETDEALTFISIAEEAAIPDDVDTHGEIAITRAIMALRDGDAGDAIQHARHALEITERRGSPWAQASFLLVLADALEEVGDREGAVESLEEALSRFEQKEFFKAAEQTRARLSELSD